MALPAVATDVPGCRHIVRHGHNGLLCEARSADALFAALERLLARTTQFRISQGHHGPADARRYTYEPTYTFRSMVDLHIEYDAA